LKMDRKSVKDFLYNNFVSPLISSKNPPWYDARGVGLGLAIGFGIPVGGHMVILAFLRLALRFNFIVAVAFTWVCNPFNMLFIYYGFYLLGSMLLGRSPEIRFDSFESLLDPLSDKTYFWEAFQYFLALGREILVAWALAAAIVAIVSGISGYLLTYYIQQHRLNARVRRLAVEYKELAEQVNENH
jgi:uncharacterized protein